MISDDNIIFGNLIKNNIHGIYLNQSDGSIITNNAFIDNEEKQTFYRSYETHWESNYWGRFRLLPKIILGKNGKNGNVPSFNFDLHPARYPNSI